MSNRALILIRHGEASFNGSSDHGRELTQNGIHNSKEIGRQLGIYSKTCCCAIVSNSTRTRQTAEHVFDQFEPSTVHYEPQLYSAITSKDLCDAINSHVKPSHKKLCIIGHNPILSEFATKLSGQVYNFAPSEYVILSIEADTWDLALRTESCWSPRN